MIECAARAASAFISRWPVGRRYSRPTRQRAARQPLRRVPYTRWWKRSRGP